MRTTPLILACASLLLGCHALSQGTDAFTGQVDRYIRPYVETKNFSGTVLVAQKGRVLYLKAFGMADEALQVPNGIDTKYHIASLSKSFTAAAILLLEERGLLHVTDRVAVFIPDFPNGHKITIHHLLIHSSGIPNINDMPGYDTIMRFHQTAASLVSAFENRRLDFEPGTKYAYCNSNYNLLALIIEKVSGKSYGTFIAENILVPLKMDNTSHDEDPHAIIGKMATGYQPDAGDGLAKADFLDWTSKTGNGSLYSTVEDLYKWDRALHTEKVLSKASLTKMFTVHIARTGYGWFIDSAQGRKRIYFNGRSPGYTAYIGRYIDDDVCIIVLSNNYSPVPTKIGNDIASILFQTNYEMPAMNNDKIDQRQAARLIGKYQFDSSFYRPGMLMTIVEKDGRLYTDWGVLIPETPLHFVDRIYWQEVRFLEDGAGNIQAIDYGGYKGVKKG